MLDVLAIADRDATNRDAVADWLNHCVVSVSANTKGERYRPVGSYRLWASWAVALTFRLLQFEANASKPLPETSHGIKDQIWRANGVSIVHDEACSSAASAKFSVKGSHFWVDSCTEGSACRTTSLLHTFFRVKLRLLQS